SVGFCTLIKWAGVSVPVSNENISVWSDHYCRRPIKCIGSIACNPGLAELHEYFADCVKLDDLLTLSVFSFAVDGPDIVVFININRMRVNEHARSEGF